MSSAVVPDTVLLRDFEEYSMPGAHTAYSSQHFASLTFEETLELSYPTILPAGSVQSWSFDVEILASAAATIIRPHEVIPHYDDLQTVLEYMPNAYAIGMRSVHLTFSIPDSENLQNGHYHLAKIRLFQQVLRHQQPVALARHLLDHISSQNILPLPVLDNFRRLRITAPISGLYSSAFPLWKIGYLVGEEWLQDTILDALAEISYFRAASEAFPDTPSVLFLPSSFLVDARRLFHKQPRVYSPELIDLRKRIRSTKVSKIGFEDWTADHFSGFFLEDFSYLMHGDSLHKPPPHDILPILNWVFSGLGIDHLQSIYPGVIDRQGVNGGNGSCGVAAHNFIARHINPTIPHWTAPSSTKIRDLLLRDLCLFNKMASEQEGRFEDWVESCITNTSENRRPVDYCGYYDFNMFKPKANHPIHKLIKALRRPDSTPLVHQLVATPVQSASELLPAAVILPTLSNGSPSSAKSVKSRSPSVTIISPPQLKQTVVQSAAGVLKPFPRLSHTSPKDEPIDIINLVSPESVKHATPISPINLVSPLPEPKCKALRFRSISLNSIEITSPVCSPKRKKLLASDDDIKIVTRSSPTSHAHAVEARTFFHWELAMQAIYDEEEALGHKWVKGATKVSQSSGELRRVTVRCNHYRKPAPQHSVAIDPSDHRRGKSIKTECMAHANIIRDPQNPDHWIVNAANWRHNHPREIPPGGHASRPPTQEMQTIISGLATASNFSRSQIKKIVELQSEYDVKHPLEPRQISNIMNRARQEKREEVSALGGDVNAIVAWLRLPERAEQGWRYDLQIDENQVVTGIWWQSPLQAELTARYHDIIIYDDTYNRNICGYPLGIGIGIDGHCKSRNLWYVMHARENNASFTWILQRHLESAGTPPEVFASDRHAALISCVSDVMPLTHHVFCLHHLSGNVTTNIRSTLGGEFPNFNRDFWAAYRAVSPDEFERLWNHLIARYPSAREYLNEELYPCREQWAWAWVSSVFTAGVRTNGRCEGENRVNKAVGGPKKTLYQLFNGLNERTDGQTVRELVQVRESSRRQHDTNIESVFHGPLMLCRKHLGPFALNTCYAQMELSCFYRTEVLQRPEGVRDWTEYGNKVQKDLGYDWENGEEKHMINGFANDKAYISTKWLLRLIGGRGLTIKHLFRVVHLGTSASHLLAFLHDGRYICDCCMGTNLGIPCCHYFRVLTQVPGMKFNIGSIRARWYQNPALNLANVPTVSLEHTMSNSGALPADPASSMLPGRLLSNPLDRAPVVRHSETLSARTVHSETQAAIRQITGHIQTQEQLDFFLHGVDDLWQEQQAIVNRNRIYDPLPIARKGRPLTQRFTGPLEGRPRGGGGSKRPISAVQHSDGEMERPTAKKNSSRCGVCRQVGHNRTKCPLVQGK